MTVKEAIASRMDSIGTHNKKHAEIVDAALNFACRVVDLLPVPIGMRQEKGQDKRGNR
jgi:hypothetical protein